MNPGLPVTNLRKLVSVEKLALIAIAIAIVLRVINLGSREFWYDEVLSLLLSSGHNSYQTPPDAPVVLAQYTSLLSLPVESGVGDVVLSIKNLILRLLRGEPHPPIFFLSQHLWLRLFGNSEVATRSLNTLLSIAAIGGAYSLGKIVLGHRGGLVLAALLSLNPFFLFHSLNLRMYAPLILWETLSASALLHLIYQRHTPKLKNRRSWLLWNVLLIGSVAVGLLTFYFYAYWIVALAILVLYLDRQHWWQHGLRLGAGVMLTIPWMLWGAIKQLRNADLNRFSSVKDFGTALLLHLQDVAQTLGSNLLLGDWVSSLSPIITTIAGCLVILLLVTSSINLWRQGEQKNLGIALILGIVPLLLALAIDVKNQSYTLGFGWGRTMIIILPGCLLLLTLWLERTIAWQWRASVASGLLLLYLTINIGDFSLRSRSVFHPVAKLVSQQANQPTLIAMNSKAWGHVMRLAYYIPPQASVMLLSQKPRELANSLERVLKDETTKYSRIIWLDSMNPLWSRLKTAAEIDTAKQNIQQVLSRQFKIEQTQNVSGTMTLDSFNVTVYTRSPKT